jgi:alpha-galactosidase
VQNDEILIMAKPMEDRSLAVGLFNLAEVPREISVDWSVLGIQGPQRVRDLWRQKDAGVAENRYTADVPRHGVMFIRIGSK